MFLQRIFMLAAVSTGTPIGGSPAPAVTCPPADVEAAHRLAVPPCLYGRDNFPGEVPFPHVRDGVQEQTTFPSQAVLTIRLPPDPVMVVVAPPASPTDISHLPAKPSEKKAPRKVPGVLTNQPARESDGPVLQVIPPALPQKPD